MSQPIAYDVEGSQVTPPQQMVSPPPAPPAQTYNNEFFTQDQLEKARREEREKVQSALARQKEQQAALKAELDELRKFREEQEAKANAEAKKEARKRKTEDEKDLSARELLARREEEYQARFDEMQRQLQQQAAQMALERQHMQLMSYIQQRVAEEMAAKNIAPQFRDYITGTSQEEVEASIELAKAKTAEIMNEFQETFSQQGHRGVSVSSGPSSMGSVPEIGQQEPDFTTMTYADYVKNRQRLQPAQKDQGIFG